MPFKNTKIHSKQVKPCPSCQNDELIQPDGFCKRCHERFEVTCSVCRSVRVVSTEAKAQDICDDCLSKCYDGYQ